MEMNKETGAQMKAPAQLVPWESLSPEKYKLIACDLITLLRGEITQRNLSQQLGYSFNQVGKWESGVTAIRFTDFLNICLQLKIPIEEKFRNFFFTYVGPFCESSCLLAIEKCIKKEEFEIIKNYESHVDLNEVLELLDRRPKLLFGWLSQLVDCEKMDFIRPYFEILQKEIELIRTFPKAVFVNSALQLEVYKQAQFHDEALLAFHGSCTLVELRQILEYLHKAGFISFNGLKYSSCSFEFSFSFLAYSSLRGMTKVATDLASQKYSLIPSASLRQNSEQVVNAAQSCFRSAALSREASLKVRDLLTQFHIQLGELIAKDQGPKDNVQVIIAHSFPTTINSSLSQNTSNNKSS